MHPDPPLWYARLLAAQQRALDDGRDLADAYARLLELGHADDGWLLLPLTGDGLDREPRKLPILMQGGEELPAMIGREYLEGERTQARRAMDLALSVLRRYAYQVPADSPELSAQRGEAIDALGLALGHTQLLAEPPAAERRRLYDPLPERAPEGLAHGVMGELATLRSTHGERLDRLERLLYGEGVGSYRPNPDRLAVLAQLDAQSSVLGNLAEALERDNDARRDLTRRVEALEPDGPGPAPDGPSPAFRPGHELDCALADGHPLPCRDTAGTDLTIPF